MQTVVRRFDELTVTELHDALALRAQVFVVEQDCVYLDPDGEDTAALHALGTEGGALVAYGRIQETAEGPRIGRVVTAPHARGRGLGHTIVAACVAAIGDRSSFLFAQDHLRAFYAEHGFVVVGDVFLEDGIPHIRMERAAGHP